MDSENQSVTLHDLLRETAFASLAMDVIFGLQIKTHFVFHLN